MRTTFRFALLAVSLSAVAGSMAQAGTVPDPAGTVTVAPAAPTAKVPEPGALVLSIRAHALGLVQEGVPESDRVPGLERMRAPTGAGTSRMPSATTEITRGVYLTVAPACIPGVDEPLGPPLPRRFIRRP